MAKNFSARKFHKREKDHLDPALSGGKKLEPHGAAAR